MWNPKERNSKIRGRVNQIFFWKEMVKRYKIDHTGIKDTFCRWVGMALKFTRST